MELTDNELQCTCGRFKLPNHCPYCGSSFIYGRMSKNKTIVRPDPAEPDRYYEEVIRNFFCRRCNQEFYDNMPCEAPPPGKKDRMRIAGLDGKRREQITPYDSKEKINTFSFNLLEKLGRANPNINLEAAKHSLAVKRGLISEEQSQELQVENIPIRGSAAGGFKEEIFDVASPLDSVDADSDDKENK